MAEGVATLQTFSCLTASSALLQQSVGQVAPHMDRYEGFLRVSISKGMTSEMTSPYILSSCFLVLIF